MLNLPAYFYFSITVISIESVLGNAWVLRSVPNQCILLYPSKLTTAHTSAKFIEIQQKSLQRRHGLHELWSHMESNDTLHGSGLVPHWVLGPKNSKFGPMGPNNFAQKFLYTKLVRYHEAILWSFEAKIVFGAKQVGNIQIPDFTLSVGQKNQIDFVWSKSSLR